MPDSGAAYGIPAVALRFFNTYGPYQALSNPYTGVLSNFASRVLNGSAPLIFEDGLQQRDFVSVYDVARHAGWRWRRRRRPGGAYNISSGVAMTVKEVAERTVKALGQQRLEPADHRKYRAGDIRHCFADISLARRGAGMGAAASHSSRAARIWRSGYRDRAAIDRGMEARAELAARGLMV